MAVPGPGRNQHVITSGVYTCAMLGVLFQNNLSQGLPCPRLEWKRNGSTLAAAGSNADMEASTH